MKQIVFISVQHIVRKQLSVRAVEALVKRRLNPATTARPKRPKAKLSDRQQKSVVITNVDADRTDVTISCTSLEELQNLLHLLGIQPNGTRIDHNVSSQPTNQEDSA